MQEKQEQGGHSGLERDLTLARGKSVRSNAPIGYTKERRKKPRIPRNTELPSLPATLADYAAIISEPELEELRTLAKASAGKSVRLVNPAPRTNAADLLAQRSRLLSELQLEVKTDFGNRPGPIPQWDEDFIVFHEVDSLEMIAPQPRRSQHRIWRCTDDSARRQAGNWQSLRALVERCDVAVMTAAAFAETLSIPQFVIYPSVDPLSDRSRQLDPSYIGQVCTENKVDRTRPIITHVSSAGQIEGQREVFQAYRLAKRYVDCQLVLVGRVNPEESHNRVFLDELLEASTQDPDIRLLPLSSEDALKLNAVERASTLVIHTPTREAFGVAAVEALWKAKPVIATAGGCISNLVIQQFTGALVHSVEGCAYQIRYLLTHHEIAERLGKNGREHVKENFLITSDLKKWLVLFQILLGSPERLAH